MKKIITTIAVFTSLSLYAQDNVGVGTLTPNPNAKLEIKSDDKGVLITRLTTVARNTLGTALTGVEDGMLVYDKDLTAFYYWDGPNLQWVLVGSGAGDNWGTQTVQTTGANITGDGTTANPITVTDGDSDATNEIELPTGGTNGQVLTTNGSGVYTWVNDDVGTDDQNIANLSFDNTTNILTIGIENGTSQTIDLSDLVNDADSDITNEIQDLSITNNILTITNNGTATNIDLSGYLDNTDDQNISGSGLVGTTLTIGIETGTNETVDLSTLVDHDWYKVGTTSAPTNINDDIFTQGNVGVGIIAPTKKLHVYNGSVFSENADTFRSALLSSDGALELYRSPAAASPNVNGFIDFKDNATDDSDFRIYYNNTVGTNGALMFSGSTTGTPSSVPHLVIRNQDGNVGINTQNPTNKLDINGDLRVRTITAGTSTNQQLVVDATGVVKKVAPSSPAGEVITFAGATAPAGFLMCDGSAVSRTTYADLFAVVGTTYGAGNGTTTFNLPDLRGEFIRGFDAGRGVDPARVFGTRQEGTIVSGGDDNNTGQLSSVGLGHLVFGDPLTAGQLASINGKTWIHTTPTNSLYAWRSPYSSARPRNIAMNYCIRF